MLTVTAATPIGDAGRNILRADGINRLDFGLLKSAQIREGHALQIHLVGASDASEGGGECDLISIEPEDAEPLVTFEQLLRMASPAEGCVEQHSCGYPFEHLGDLVNHHRLVVEWLGHRTPRSRRPGSRSAKRSSASAPLTSAPS